MDKNTEYKMTILRIIREREAISRMEIHKETGIRLSTISDISKELIAQGLLLEASDRVEVGNEKLTKKSLLLNKDFCCVIGIDIQADNIIAVITDFCGNITFHTTLPILSGAKQKDIQHRLYQTIDFVLTKTAGVRILGIGISTIGMLDRKTNKITMVFENPSWSNVNLLSMLESRYPQYRFFLEDQVVCRLLAEKWFSRKTIPPNTVYVDIGSVIGTSILFNGVLLRNNVGAIGEIGHFCVSAGDELCTCGNQGCLMTVASSNVIIRQIKQALKQGTISSLANPDYSDLTIQMILNAAEGNDRLAIHYLSNAAQYIGKAISYIVNLLGPEMVIIGGSMITESNFFFDSIVTEVKRFSLYLLIDNLRFQKASLNYYGGALGAVCIVLDEAFSTYLLEF